MLAVRGWATGRAYGEASLTLKTAVTTHWQSDVPHGFGGLPRVQPVKSNDSVAETSKPAPRLLLARVILRIDVVDASWASELNL